MDSNNTENTWGGVSPKFTRRQYFYLLTHEQTWQGWLGETPYKHSSYSLKMSSLLFSWSSFVDFVSFSLWRCKAERHRVCVAPCQPVTSNVFVILKISQCSYVSMIYQQKHWHIFYWHRPWDSKEATNARVLKVTLTSTGRSIDASSIDTVLGILMKHLIKKLKGA